jgi:hypothetical protein
MKNDFLQRYCYYYFQNCEDVDRRFPFMTYDDINHENTSIEDNNIFICTNNKTFIKKCLLIFKPKQVIEITPYNFDIFLGSEYENIIYTFYACTYGFVDKTLMNCIIEDKYSYTNTLYQYGIQKTLEQPKYLLKMLEMDDL